MGRYSWMPDHPPKGVDPKDVFYSPEKVLAPHRDGGGRAKSICVIGAGIAGLVAAYELLQEGHSVTIVEAEHRVGGRIRTWYSGSVNAELGPMRVPQKHRGTIHYMKAMGLRMDRFVQRNEETWLALRGQKVRRAAWQTLLPLYGGAPALFRLPVGPPATPVDDVLIKAEDLAGIDLSGAEPWGVMSGWLGPKAQQLASMTFWEAITGQWGAVGASLLTDLGWELVGQATSCIREERISGLEAWIEGTWTLVARIGFASSRAWKPCRERCEARSSNSEGTCTWGAVSPPSRPASPRASGCDLTTASRTRESGSIT